MLGWVVKALVGRGEGTRSSGAKRNGVAVLCVVWCGVLLSVGGRGAGDGIDFYVCEKYKMMDINLLATSPCSLPLTSPAPLPLSPPRRRRFFSLSPWYYLSVSCLSFSHSLARPLALSFSLILRPFSTHSPRVVHEVVTLVYTTARDHTRPCARYTRTRAFHTNASRPYNLTSLTEEEEEEKEGEGEAGGWRSLSARRSRFPTPPRGHPWPPRAAANLTQLPSVSPPFLPRATTNPFGCTSSGPRAPIPCGSSERMFCHHTTLHAAPNSPSNRPGLLAPSACTPSPLSPPLCPKAPRQIHSQPRTHLEFPL